jgi:GT2 family glycosyltransferase
VEVAYLEGHPGVVLSICQAREIDERGKAIREWPRSSDGPISYSSAISLQLLLYHGCIAGNLSTMCVRRALVQEVGGFDETYRLAGDYDLLVRLCQRGPIVDLQKALVKIRRHDGRLSLSKPARTGFVDETRRIRAQLIPMLGTGSDRMPSKYYWRRNVPRHALHPSMPPRWRFATAGHRRIMGVRDVRLVRVDADVQQPSTAQPKVPEA